MTNFIIDKINIEKSEKDIKTGTSYDFSSGLNFICGNNEAGKSSLMKFIKEGFFCPAKSDYGKIFFTVENKKYRADINPKNAKADRCKFFDNEGNKVDYSTIEKFINQKYFTQGFTINLDDLISLKIDDKTTLINVIKDPSGDKLNALLQPISSIIYTYIGERKKPKSSFTNISNRISELTKKINELSNKEIDYINASNTLKNLEKEISTLNEKENYINSLITKRDNDKKINEINVQIQEKKSQLNIKVYDAREEYAQLAQDIGKYELNLDSIEKTKQKIDGLENKIKGLFSTLQNNFGIIISENDITGFEINIEKINKIKSTLDEINAKNTDINTYEKQIEDIQETILKLENECEFIKNGLKNLSIDEATSLYTIIDEGLKQIKSLEYDINEMEKENYYKNGLILFAKTFITISTLASILISAYFFNLNKITYASIFLVLFAIIIGFGIATIRKLFSNKKIERKQNLKDNIIKELMEKIQKYAPQTTETNGFLAISKLEEIKQELKLNIDKITQNSIDYEFNITRVKKIQEKINTIKEEINKNENKIKELIEKNITSDIRTYFDAINIIKELKNEIENKQIATKELQKTTEQNSFIIDKFNSFLKENEINITLSSNLKENFEELAKYIENNNEIKKDLDMSIILVENLKIKEVKTDTMQVFEDITVTSDLECILEENKMKKKELQEQKHITEVQKSRLEEVESLVNLKNERNLKINEIRTITEEILTARTIENITNIAKGNFDKTQPDLVNAQKYLSILTDNKYSKINLEMQEISDEKQTVIKKWDELSRGTKEQLYLALRLGYASNYSIKDNKRPNLPLIVDDAFVNFDPQRTQNALKCLVEFSKTNQILFFTCHTQTIKSHLKDIGFKGNVNIIEI